MTTVPDEPLIRPLGRDSNRWVLAADFVVITDTLGTITVPTGFVTDFNSIPRVLWNLLPPTDYPEAALPHDFLYRYGSLNGKPVQREDADKVHRELLVWAEAPGWKVSAYYRALRIGGWWAWRQSRKGDATRPLPSST